jgi:hypothetical protein
MQKVSSVDFFFPYYYIYIYYYYYFLSYFIFKINIINTILY